MWARSPMCVILTVMLLLPILFLLLPSVHIRCRTEHRCPNVPSGIMFWGGLADLVERYVHKGDRIYVEGKIRTNTYEDQNGIRRYRTEILAETMEMLSSRTAGAAPVADVPGQGTAF